MSSQELKELSDLRRKNRSLYERVEEMRRSLNLQIKMDAGKVSAIPQRLSIKVERGDGAGCRNG